MCPDTLQSPPVPANLRAIRCASLLSTLPSGKSRSLFQLDGGFARGVVTKEGSVMQCATLTQGTRKSNPSKAKRELSLNGTPKNYVPLVAATRQRRVPACEDAPPASKDAGGDSMPERLKPFTQGLVEDSKIEDVKTESPSTASSEPGATLTQKSRAKTSSCDLDKKHQQPHTHKEREEETSANQQVCTMFTRPSPRIYIVKPSGKK